MAAFYVACEALLGSSEDPRQISCCVGNGVSVNVGLRYDSLKPETRATWEPSTINLSWS